MPGPASQTRRAALLAHALPLEDQAWLLGSLPPHSRLLLQGLLAELRELGIPADPAWLDALAPPAPPAPPAPAATTATGAGALQTLAPAQVRALALVLQREGCAVAAALLAARRWSWRDALLDACDRDFAGQVRQAGARPPAAGLEAALCDALLREIEAVTRTGPQLPFLGLWQRARRVVRAGGGERA